MGARMNGIAGSGRGARDFCARSLQPGAGFLVVACQRLSTHFPGLMTSFVAFACTILTTSAPLRE